MLLSMTASAPAKGESRPTGVALARLAAGGDCDALEALLREHAADIHRLCHHVLGPNEGADGAQRALERIVRRIGSFDADKGTFRSWALTVAHNACRDRLRRLTAVFFDLPQESREVMRLVRRDINIFGEPARTELVKAYQASLPELIEGVIREGIRGGELAPADPRLLSWHFVALVEVMLSTYADRSFSDAEGKLDYVMELFFRGAGPRQGANV